MEKKWEEMSPDEKQEAQFQKLLTPKDPEGNDLKFQSPEAEAAYKASITRIKDAVQLKKTPDRVPTTLLPSMFPFSDAGMTIEEAMYDYEKCAAAFKKFILEFKPDMHIGAAQAGPGKFYEILDYKLYKWPGHGVAPEHSYQCLEGEYMKAEEYDLLITDPSFYFRNFYLPRVFGALEGFTMLPPLTGILEIYGVAFNFIPFALPPVQGTFKALFEAGAEALKELVLEGKPDTIFFASPSAIDGILTMAGSSKDIQSPEFRVKEDSDSQNSEPGTPNSDRGILDIPAICIGPTTALAAEEAGFSEIYFPD